jgi:site-specific DNA-methyltransferase (adenine-specific)
MDHRFIVGDAHEELRIMAHAATPRPHLVVVSPPYNLDMGYDGSDDNISYTDYLDWSYRWLAHLNDATDPQARLCLNVPLDTNLGGPRPIFADLIAAAREAGWKYRHSIVWNEQNISRRTAWGSWMKATAPNVIAPVEMIGVFHKGDWKRGGGTSTISRDEFMAWTLGHWTFPGESAKRVGHPAPFPLELPRRLIHLYSFAEDTVLDPFGGSGTTNVAAALAGRRSIYIDKSAEYAELAKARLAALAIRPSVAV